MTLLDYLMLYVVAVGSVTPFLYGTVVILVKLIKNKGQYED